ncbi:hypothetical protein [Actinosynnema sp. NPDC020468]|uniref:hypothetical protein n=1 Tax=Actinosynnema sp. NPDC020468 TaxID=3154488 RepID=UPI0033F5CBCB
MIRELLFKDVDGAYHADPHVVIDGAVAHPGYRDRIPALRAVLEDAGAERYHRFLAVVALAAWGHGPVYGLITGLAGLGEGSPWFGMLAEDGRDTTFATVAGAVGEGRAFTEGEDERARVAALRALLDRADVLAFGWELAHAVAGPEFADDIAVLVDRAAETSPLPLQLADLVTALARHDRERAVPLARRLLRRDSGRSLRIHLATVVPYA